MLAYVMAVDLLLREVGGEFFFFLSVYMFRNISILLAIRANTDMS